MDPITVVGFVAAIVQLIDITSKAVNYFNDVRSAPKDRAKLAREATNLLSLFTELRYRVEETTSTDPWFTGLRSLGEKDGPLMDFKNEIERIANKLDLTPAPGLVNLRRVLCWTLDKKEIGDILSKIERLKTLIGLALQKDHFKLSLAMKEEFTEEFHLMKINRNVEKIEHWLAAPLPSSNHNTAMKKRQPRTGEWFMQSKEFAHWKIERSSFLWLHGIPGCGKTILCSTIIQEVLSNFQSEPTIAVAYFYFDFNDSEKQNTEKFIRSLVVQLSAQCLHLPESLQSAYSRSQNGQNQLTIEDLTLILRQLLKSFNSAYILLDALDECADREDLLDLINVLRDWNIHDLHVLATSRKENDIATSLEPLVTCQLCIQSALIDADIRLHILERLSNDPKLKKWPVSVQKEIENALMRGSKGMFRWVVCQLDSVRKCLKLDALRKALNTLPKTLDDTYERILSNLDQEYKEDALRIFQWLCFSARPMRLHEIVEVLAIDSTPGSGFCPDQRLPDPRDILTICSTLVSITATAKGDTSKHNTRTLELRLAHFSVKEYLISDRLKQASMHHYHITQLSTHFSIANTCLTYLLHFESPTIIMAEADREFPLLRYAAEFWPWHYRSIINDADREAVDILGFNLVKKKQTCFINWLRTFNADQPQSGIDGSLRLEKTGSPVYFMAHLGVSGVLKMLLNQGADFNAEGGTCGNALSAASSSGHEEVVRLLLERGVNVNAEGGFHGNALSAASCNGHGMIVRLLLDNGANVNAEGGFHGSALSAASSDGHEMIVRLLLEHGADVNAEGGTYGTPLSAASWRGHEEVVRLLLSKGANVTDAEGGWYGNALSAASDNGYEGVVRLLLERGVDTNAEDRFHGNALSAASNSGYEGVVRLLLEHGANVNAEGGRYGTALSAASYNGHERVVRLLLDKGADVNNGRGYYGNALSAASWTGQEEVVRLLLDEGANVDAEGGALGTALSAASCEGHEEVVRLLLERGADVNAQSGSALRVASECGQKAVMRLLLKNKADINLALHDNDEALQGVSVDDDEAVIQLLLKKL